MINKIILVICLISVSGFVSGCADYDINATSYNPGNSEYYFVGEDGHRIMLHNNINATDPTYSELISFLAADCTDEHKYIIGSYTCGDYAEDIHNNAEAAGIKSAWVELDFTDGGYGHALNAFNTTDKGLVFIDCTENDGEINNFGVGNKYTPESIFDSQEFECMGTVSRFEIYW